MRSIRDVHRGPCAGYPGGATVYLCRYNRHIYRCYRWRYMDQQPYNSCYYRIRYRHSRWCGRGYCDHYVYIDNDRVLQHYYSYHIQPCTDHRSYQCLHGFVYQPDRRCGRRHMEQRHNNGSNRWFYRNGLRRSGRHYYYYLCIAHGLYVYLCGHGKSATYCHFGGAIGLRERQYYLERRTRGRNMDQFYNECGHCDITGHYYFGSRCIGGYIYYNIYAGYGLLCDKGSDREPYTVADRRHIIGVPGANDDA
jgi:hypothetical protein